VIQWNKGSQDFGIGKGGLCCKRKPGIQRAAKSTVFKAANGESREILP